jgi:nucleoid DNA-binding protein
MTTADIVLKLQEIIGEDKVSKAEAKRIWNALIETIEEEVKANGELKFGSLFKVYKKHVKARKARNPKTGEEFMTKEKDVLACKVLKGGKTLFEK